jgi:hypothetical protein
MVVGRIDRTLHLGERLVAGDGHDLLRRRTGLGEPPRATLAEAVQRTMLRQRVAASHHCLKSRPSALGERAVPLCVRPFVGQNTARQREGTESRAMKAFLFTCALLAGTAGISSHADAQNYPWCARCAKGGDTENCGFTTFDQCLADVRGGGGYCVRNTQYVPSVPRTSRPWHYRLR